MSKNRKTVASTYHYDPLNRLTGANNLQRFYNNTRIATEIEGERKTRFFEVDSQPLALQQHGTAPSTTLLASDQQTSVLNGVSLDGGLQAQAYSPFGYHRPGNDLLAMLGFNGERPDPITGHYLLGRGYRAFNPVLMRFNSPDSWSPFEDGGINGYASFDNNPVMMQDPTGHVAEFLKPFLKWANLIGSTDKTTKKLTAKHASLIKAINKNAPNDTALLNPTQEMLKLSKKILLDKSENALNTGMRKIKESEIIRSKIGSSQPEFNVLNRPRLKRARDTTSNPVDRTISNNQKNLDNQRRASADKIKNEAIQSLKKSEQHLHAAIEVRRVRLEK